MQPALGLHHAGEEDHRNGRQFLGPVLPLEVALEVHQPVLHRGLESRVLQRVDQVVQEPVRNLAEEVDGLVDDGLVGGQHAVLGDVGDHGPGGVVCGPGGDARRDSDRRGGEDIGSGSLGGHRAGVGGVVGLGLGFGVVCLPALQQLLNHDINLFPTLCPCKIHAYLESLRKALFRHVYPNFQSAGTRPHLTAISGHVCMGDGRFFKAPPPSSPSSLPPMTHTFPNMYMGMGAVLATQKRLRTKNVIKISQMPICGVLALAEWAERYVLCIWYQYVCFERSLKLEPAGEGGG